MGADRRARPLRAAQALVRVPYRRGALRPSRRARRGRGWVARSAERFLRGARSPARTLRQDPPGHAPSLGAAPSRAGSILSTGRDAEESVLLHVAAIHALAATQLQESRARRAPA